MIAVVIRPAFSNLPHDNMAQCRFRMYNNHYCYNIREITCLLSIRISNALAELTSSLPDIERPERTSENRRMKMLVTFFLTFQGKAPENRQRFFQYNRLQ